MKLEEDYQKRQKPIELAPLIRLQQINNDKWLGGKQETVGDQGSKIELNTSVRNWELGIDCWADC